jgi:hypothetical protein
VTPGGPTPPSSFLQRGGRQAAGTACGIVTAGTDQTISIRVRPPAALTGTQRAVGRNGAAVHSVSGPTVVVMGPPPVHLLFT